MGVILEGNVGFLKESQATFFLGGLNRMNTGKGDGSKVKDVKPEHFEESRPWALWGDDDQFPETVRTNVKTSVMLSRGLQHTAKLLYGNGILTYKLDEEGVIVPFTDPQFEKFKKDSHLNHYLSRACYQHGFYNNIFPRIIFSRDKKTVNKIICEKSRYGRWEKINADSGLIENCYISAWFDTFPNSADKKRVKTLPVINLFDDNEEILADDNTFEYVYRAMYPLCNEDYYAVPAWQSAVESGWVDVEKDVPALKKKMFENGMFPKWHIQIPYDHWEMKFGKDVWDKFDEKQKKEKILEQLEEMNKFLTGTDNAYKAFISHYGTDPITGKEQAGWKIEALKASDESDKYLPEADEAATQISYALGLNRAIFGSNSNGQGAGSGSDIRESFLIATSMLRLDRDFIFMPLYFARDYNGWDPDMLFGFRDTVLTTLDKNPTGSEKVVSN
jgi:hypothetical protein